MASRRGSVVRPSAKAAKAPPKAPPEEAEEVEKAPAVAVEEEGERKTPSQSPTIERRVSEGPRRGSYISPYQQQVLEERLSVSDGWDQVDTSLGALNQVSDGSGGGEQGGRGGGEVETEQKGTMHIL